MRWILVVTLFACAPKSGGQAPPPKRQAEDHKHKHMPHRFEKAEDWVKRFEGPERTSWQKPEEIVRLLEIKPGMTVVDLGAGTGYFLPYLSRAVGPTGKVIALDVEADMVRYIKERAVREHLGNVTAKQIATDSPGLDPGTADRIVIVNTWHHIANRREYAQALARALPANGLVMIVDFTQDARLGPPPHHRLTAATVEQELAHGALNTRTLPETLPHQYIVVGIPNHD